MRFTTYIKRLIYPLYIYPRVTSAKKRKLHKLFSHFEENPASGIPKIRLFSNMEEDGIILRLLASLHIREGYFVDIGSNDCINSNCANLAFNFNWKGVFIDADQQLLNIGRKNYRLFNKESGNRYVQSFLTPDNVNDVVSKNVITADIDFLNIDIDGNDFAIWKTLNCIQPKLVVVENKIEYGSDELVTESGASLVSFNNLAASKGYTLVATNYEGFNAFFMRDDLLEVSGLKPLDVNSVLGQKHIRDSFYSK